MFTRTKQGDQSLARELAKSGIAADAIHGDKSQSERLKALEAFKDGSVRCSSPPTSPRGLDIDELPHVINFELPHTPEDYVHRIGRTGRAGKKGTAVSLVSADEVQYLVDIEKLIKIAVDQVIIPASSPNTTTNTRRRAKEAPPPAGASARWPHRAANRASPRATARLHAGRATSHRTASTSARPTCRRNSNRWAKYRQTTSRTRSRTRTKAEETRRSPARRLRDEERKNPVRRGFFGGRDFHQLEDGDGDVVALAVGPATGALDQHARRFAGAEGSHDPASSTSLK